MTYECAVWNEILYIMKSLQVDNFYRYSLILWPGIWVIFFKLHLPFSMLSSLYPSPCGSLLEGEDNYSISRYQPGYIDLLKIENNPRVCREWRRVYLETGILAVEGNNTQLCLMLRVDGSLILVLYGSIGGSAELVTG